jgi:phosphate transport system permease protein
VSAASPARRSRKRADLRAHGEPFRWAMGGALALGICLILGFLLLVFWNGITTFWPGPIAVVELADGSKLAGEPTRSESFEPRAEQLAAAPPDWRARVASRGGFVGRTLYRTGNYDLYNEDFRWVAEYEVASLSHPPDLLFVERLEWGPFIGRVAAVTLGGASFGPGEIAPGNAGTRSSTPNAARSEP